MSLKQYIKEHILGHYLSDDIATFTGGALFANIFTTKFISHIFEVALVGFIGGACGLIGKLLIQFIYDKYFKKNGNTN
jgi:ABC-type bacteriocin/lantibiotic exporter with double-glycine peptidase domain